MTDELKEEGCSCHICAPCSFCTSLTEEEVIILENEGMNGLWKYWKEREAKGLE